jgi:hypothetical protein
LYRPPRGYSRKERRKRGASTAKQGQHQDDTSDPTKSKGPNNPSKSVPITTGSSKKQETYQRQAAENRNTGPARPVDKNEWDENTRVKGNHEGVRQLKHPRSGSDKRT